MLFSPQIPLQLEPSREQRFENFVPGPNGALVAALRETLMQQDGRIFLSGSPGSGKTHLLNALCVAARSAGQTAFYAGMRRWPRADRAMLEGLERIDLVCIDDVDAAVGDRDWEEAVFHFFNRQRETGGSLVASSREPLSALPFTLPDLASRLQWGVRLTLQPLDDADKLAVLQAQATALGIALPDEVGRYLIRHSHRQLGALVHTLERIQQAVFADKRRVTVPLVRDIIGSDD